MNSTLNTDDALSQFNLNNDEIVTMIKCMLQLRA